MADHDAFVVHPRIDRLLRVHRLTRAGAEPAPTFRRAVASALRWITGGGDEVTAEREATPGAERGRGRGGPRCLSCPLERR